MKHFNILLSENISVNKENIWIYREHIGVYKENIWVYKQNIWVYKENIWIHKENMYTENIWKQWRGRLETTTRSLFKLDIFQSVGAPPTLNIYPFCNFAEIIYERGETAALILFIWCSDFHYNEYPTQTIQCVNSKCLR